MQEMRRHLATGCVECAGHFAEAQAVFHSIPGALDPVTPPAGLKQRLMDRISQTESKKQISVPINELAADSLPIRLFKLFVPVAVAASVAVVVTHGFMSQKVQHLVLEAKDAQREANASKMLLASVQEQFRSQSQVVEMLRSPEVKVVHLQPTAALQPSATANVIWDQVDHRWLFLASGFKPADPGQTYELWIIPKGGTPVPAGTFDVDPKGRAIVAVDLPKNIGDSNTAAVSNERLGGESSPKGKIQVVGPIE